MKRLYSLGCLLLVWLLPLTGGAQSSVSPTAAVLHDHLAGQLSPGVQAWVAAAAAQLARTGHFSATAQAVDIQAHFAGQPVGTPEIQALTLIILVQAAQSAGATMTNSQTQLAAIESARADALRQRLAHPQLISLNTVPNRTVSVPSVTNHLATNQPVMDPQMERQLYEDFIRSEVVFKSLTHDLPYFQSQATELVNARLESLK